MHLYIQIMGLQLPSYGLLIATGVVIANFVSYLILRKTKQDGNDFIILEAYGILGGFIGAKVLYLIVSRNQIDWNRITDITYANQLMLSGFVFYGGLIGGILFIFLAGKIHKIPALEYIRNFIFVIPFIHSFGRIGCFMAGCCYGKPYDGSFAVVFPENSYALPGVKLFPIQLVEAGGLMVIAILLIILRLRFHFVYTIEFYFIVYGLFRFILEYFRYDAIRGSWGAFTTSQWISLVFIVIGMIAVFRSKIRKGRDGNSALKRKTFICLCGVLLLVGITVIWHKAVNDKTIRNPDVILKHAIKDTQPESTEILRTTQTEKMEKTIEAEKVNVPELSAQREDTGHIKIRWADDLDGLVTGYFIERCDNRAEIHTWDLIDQVKIEEHVKGQLYEYTDALNSTDPQQYIYRIVPQFRDSDAYVAVKEPGVLCSNWKICIDPGHYAGKNDVPGPDSYGYAEGDFTLPIALELKEKLEKEYGIAVCMTRDTGSISIGGYTDASLDSGHISLRGAYAAEQQCDLFVSIHTNANEDNANGAATYQQPISIDKPIIIANDRMLSSQTLCAVCNQIGKNLADVSYDMGISSHKDFAEITGNNVREWTISYNDSTDESGTVVCRHGDHGQYYGVLRGAEEAGVPGIIIEHGYHTVAEMRAAAQNSNLKSKWAEADAQGIASGLNFQKQNETDKR